MEENCRLLSCLEDNAIKSLLEQYGSPLYVFDEKGFRKNYLELVESFRKVYPNYTPAYSYKTNYTPYICKIVKELGGYAEVVSDMELYLAKKIGYSAKQIIYNGPCKGEMLDEFLLEGGVSNIDNVDEAIYIAKIARNNPQATIRTAIRLNFDVDAGYISRFGIESDSKELDTAFNVLREEPNIKICGLHCHISRARGIEAWEKRITTLLTIADKYFCNAPDFIDVGSGMFASMDEFLSSQFDMHIPSYSEYAQIVGGAMEKHYSKSDKKPILFSEPGTTVIARYISLLTTVNNIKNIKSKSFITTDSSYYNTGEICHWKKLPFRIISNNKISKADCETNIMGYTCLEQDCIYTEFPYKLSVGDMLVWGNVGGYSIVSKPPFIRPNCGMVAIREDNSTIEIMRKETFEDVFNKFKF